MNSQLIVHQPYRTLLMLHSELSLSQDELGLAWSCINDHYMTDLPLLHAPHTIAVTALVLTLVVLPSRAVAASAAAQQAAAFAAAQQQSQSQQSHSHHLGHHHHAAGTANNNQHANLAAVAANGAMGGAGATATSLAGSAVVGGLSAAQVMTALAHVTSTGTAQQQQPRDGQQVGTPSQSSTALAARSKMGQFALWLAESNVDLEAVVDCCQEMVSFYECYDQYNEKLTREQIHRYIKARGLDK